MCSSSLKVPSTVGKATDISLSLPQPPGVAPNCRALRYEWRLISIRSFLGSENRMKLISLASRAAITRLAYLPAVAVFIEHEQNLEQVIGGRDLNERYFLLKSEDGLASLKNEINVHKLTIQ